MTGEEPCATPSIVPEKTIAVALAVMLAGAARGDEWPPSFARVHLVPDTLGCDGDKLKLYPHWKTTKPSGPDAHPIVAYPGGRNIFGPAAAIA